MYKLSIASLELFEKILTHRGEGKDSMKQNRRSVTRLEQTSVHAAPHPLTPKEAQSHGFKLIQFMRIRACTMRYGDRSADAVTTMKAGSGKSNPT